MLNHNEVIKKLTIKQKFALLTDIQSLSDPEMTKAGVPQVSILTLKKLMAEQYEGLSPSRLANSWDAELIEQVSYQTAVKANAQQTGAKLLIPPVAKPQLNVYQTALSEDPFLSGTLAAAYAAGIGRAGSGCCLDGFYLTGVDVEQLDISPDMDVIGEMVIKPHIIAGKDQKYQAVLTAGQPLSNEYRNVNEKLLTSKDAIRILGGAARLCKPRNDEETLSAILCGQIVIRGGSTALEGAYDHYHHLLRAMEDEAITVEDLDEALADGSAISDDMLNKAVAHVLDFAQAIAQVSAKAAEKPSVGVKDAVLSSAVLLKNDKPLLPLKSRCRVVVLGGDPSWEEFIRSVCLKASVTVVGQIPADCDAAQTAAALTLAKKADRILVFLGCTEEQSRLAIRQREMALPAKQAEVLHKLGAYKDKIVGIVDCEHALDVNFASGVSSLLMAPIGGPDSADALADLLTGRANPSGKLTCTLYENPSEHFARLRRCKNAGTNKVGQFLGYRHYDSSNIEVGFPFGHGLSYTTFKYSDLRVTSDNVSFTVKNAGSVAGTEIAQIYVGKPSSGRIRPRKELCGFAKVHLKRGESRKITVDISHVSFYNAEQDAWSREQGQYMVYVGSSVTDIRLSQSVHTNGKAYTASEEKLSDYLQTHSNILTSGYSLQPVIPKRKKHWRLKLLVGILVVVAAAFFGIGGAAPQLIPDYLNQSLTAILTKVGLIGGGISLVGAITVLIIDRYRTKRSKIKQEAAADMAKAKHLESATEKEFDSIEELFIEEFDVATDTTETATEDKAYVDDTSRYIDLNYTLQKATEDLARFMQGRGINFSTAEAIRLLSAMGASRLILMGVKGVPTDGFCQTLAAYFGSPVCIETVRSEYMDTHMMFRAGKSDGLEKTDLAKLVEKASDSPNTIHLVVLRGVRASQLTELLMPYTKYFSNPLRENRIIVKDPSAIFTLPANLWFMVELAEGEKLDANQTGILKMAADLRMNISKCDAASKTNPPTGLGYYQFDHLVQQQKNRFFMDEDLWKKIDELEAYTNAHVPFHIGNKQWLQMEKYLALLTTAEEDVFAALDRALCVNLLPTVIALLKGKIPAGEPDLLETVDKIFGEDKVPLCAKAVKNKDTSAPASELYE